MKECAPRSVTGGAFVILGRDLIRWGRVSLKRRPPGRRRTADAGAVRQPEVTMPKTRRRDVDEEFAAWLQALKDSRLPAAQLNELYQAREEARAVKDTGSPAFADAHERIDRALAGLGY